MDISALTVLGLVFSARPKIDLIDFSLILLYCR